MTSTTVSSEYFREVLANFPTGVVAITAIDSTGQPMGMTVGSFTSASLDPPLVAFLPARTSSTFPRIRAAASFCINVLSAEQESLCRRFAIPGGDKFADVEWGPSPSGAPILAGAVAWIDCVLADVHDAGDHHLVLARVTDLGSGELAVPLLFFQGGYGAFAPQALVLGGQQALETQLRLADLVRDGLTSISREFGIEARAAVVQDDQQVVVAVARPEGNQVWPVGLGTRLPFVPPWNATYLAWADETELEGRSANWASSFGSARADEFAREIASVREFGWSVVFKDAEEQMDEVGRLLDQQRRRGETPWLARRLSAVVSDFKVRPAPSSLDDSNAPDVVAVTVPVFDETGSVPMVLVAFGQDSTRTAADVLACRDRLLEVAAEAERRSRGRRPETYRVRP